MKFSNKLSFAILITGIIVLILLSFTIYRFSYDSVLKSQFRYTKSIADEVSGDIDQLLHEKVKTTLTLANTPIIKKALEKSNLSYASLSDEKRKKSIKLLNEKWKSTKDPADNFILKFTDNKVSHFLKSQQTLLKGEYGEIFLSNKFGALVASTSKLSTLAHGHKYWWLGCYKNGNGAVFFDDRGYDDSVGGYVLGLVVPIKKGSEIIGILKCNLNILGSVSELISGAENKLIGKFKLIRSGGMVVFEEGFEPLSTQVHNSIFDKLRSKDNESFIIKDSGEKYLVGFSEIKLTSGKKGYGFGGTFESIDHKKGNTGESWYVICYRQMSVVLAPIIASIKSIILIGFVIILILVSVSYLFGRKIAKPIAILDRATEKIGKGGFEYRIDMTRNDEFGNLAHSFNSMASRLQQSTTSIVELNKEIDERKQAEKTLRESERFFNDIFESIQDGISILNSDLTIHHANGVMKQWYAGSLPLEGKKCHVCYQNRSEPCDPCPTLRCFQSGQTEWEIVPGPPGSPVEWMEVFSFPIREEDPAKVKKVIELVRDISDQTRLEIQAQEISKMEAIATLAGGVAHEFNNALMGILGNLELLKMDLPEDERRDRYFEAMKGSGHRMSRLTDQLLAYAQGGKYQPKNLKIDDFMIQTVSILRHDLNPAIKIETVFQKDISYIRADYTQMQMVLSAILANSNEAIEDEGFIKISAENKDIDEDFTKQHPGLKPGPHVCLTIEDDGKGMDEEAKDGIFEPFFTTKFQGRGMGMAAVYGIVKNHDGSIFVDSGLGKGTTVRIYLPVSEIEAATPKRAEVGVATGSGTVLMIEDEDMVIEVTQAMLAMLGYRVMVAKTGEDAIHIAETFDGQIDLALLDIKLPDMEGGKIYPLIMKARPHLKMIIYSGYDIDGPAREILDAGAQDFIQKPFSLSTLSEKLKKVLEGK